MTKKLRPVKSTATTPEPPRRRNKRTSKDDPLWSIIGIADSSGSPNDPVEVSENKYKYLGFAVMERLGISWAFTFNRDFAQYGWTLLSPA